jgi:hypothetical protein
MAWLPKVNRHVSYRTSTGRVRPGTITAYTPGDPEVPTVDTIDIRVGHHGETHTGLIRDVTSTFWVDQ